MTASDFDIAVIGELALHNFRSALHSKRFGAGVRRQSFETTG
jgi:hypothetical protein